MGRRVDVDCGDLDPGGEPLQVVPAPGWLSPVVADLRRLAPPRDLAAWTLALLALTEMERVPTPTVAIHADRTGWVLKLAWAVEGRVLRLTAIKPGGCVVVREWPGARWSRGLDRDHVGRLRRLLSWVVEGEEVGPWS